MTQSNTNSEEKSLGAQANIQVNPQESKQEQPASTEKQLPVCQNCGKTFDGKPGRKYCSQECNRQALSKMNKERNKNRPQNKSRERDGERKEPHLITLERKPKEDGRGRFHNVVKRQGNLQIVEIETPPKPYKRRQILIQMRKQAMENKNNPGKYLSMPQWRKKKLTPSVSYICNQFGSWEGAIKLAKALPPIKVYKLERTRIN